MDVGRDVRVPLGLNEAVVVEIELAVDDAPHFGIAGRGVVLRHRPGAVPAVLWHIGRWVFPEQLLVFRAREMPGRALVDGGERGLARHRLSLLEIGNNVVTARTQRREQRGINLVRARERALRGGHPCADSNREHGQFGPTRHGRTYFAWAADAMEPATIVAIANSASRSVM